MARDAAAAAKGGGGANRGGQGAAGGRHIDAFTLEHMLEEKRVACLEVWSHYVLVGLTDGTLLLVSQRRRVPSSSSLAASDADGSSASAGTDAAQAAQQAPGQPPPWAVVQSLRNFGKGQIKQLQVARERSMLLCLADDGVNAYVLPGLRLKAQAGRSRGASLFAWHGGSDTLAVVTKKRLALFKYEGLEFVFQREAYFPDAPTCMQLVGGTLYVGLARREYMTVDVATAIVTPLFTTKGPAASMVPVSATEVLLARDSSGVLYGPEGRPSKRGGGSGAVDWAVPPAVLAVSEPYAVAVSEAGVEARLLQPLNAADLWQQLALALPAAATSCGVAPTAAADGSLFLASRGTGAIKQLRPVSFARQAEQLLGLGEHEEALAMAALIPLEQAEERRQLEDIIHLGYGRLLFRQGQYEEAMLHFGMSGLAGPLHLLRLFPSLAPPKLLAAAAAEQAAAAAEAAAASAVAGEGVGTREPSQAGEQAAAEAVQELEEAADAEPQGEAFVAAVQVVTPYLLSHRSRLAAAAASPARPATLLGGGGGSQQHTPQAVAGLAGEVEVEMGPSPSTRAVMVQQQLEGSATAALLDTSLLLALLAMPDSGALLRFVHRPNCVDLEAGEAALKGSGRYSELVALYQTKGRHSAALELLHALSQSPEQLPSPPQGAAAELRGLPGVWAAVKYVCHMPEGERDLGLISTHAKWMLAADPDAGLEMFGSMDPPLPPSAVLPMLTSYAPQLAGLYLEAALATGAADPSVYEQELARIYLERIARSTSSTIGAAKGAGAGKAAGKPAGKGAAKVAGEAAEGVVDEAAVPEYGKLKQLILSSCRLNYEALLLVIPQHRMLEIRAALLERLGRHTEALRIYIHRLRQLGAAEAYCDRVYQRRQQQLREQRHAELAAALRWQRQAASAAAGSGGAAPAGWASSSIAGLGGSSGSIRSLQFGGGGHSGSGTNLHAAGVPATKLQRAAGSGGDSEDGADIYLLMVQVLLEEEDSSGTFHHVEHAPDHAVWGEVARLLSRKRDAIQPLHALSLLPGEVPLASALPFLEGALWGAGERRRTAAVARNLRRSEHVGLLGELADARQRHVLLTPERNCSICYKRVGSAALVVFPTGMLAHYSCHRRASGAGQQASGRASADGTANGRVAVGAGGGSSFREWS